MDTADPIEHAVNSLPPFMQRRMAKLVLAGARFVMEQHGLNAWKVEVGDSVMGRYMYLARAINEFWLKWLQHKPRTEADFEIWTENDWLFGSSAGRAHGESRARRLRIRARRRARSQIGSRARG